MYKSNNEIFVAMKDYIFIPEYCRNLDEAEIQENAFHLIFAFDEIVALGYRESVNLAQIRTFVEMDSHEEKVYKAVRETQEREARTKMKLKNCNASVMKKQKEEENHPDILVVVDLEALGEAMVVIQLESRSTIKTTAGSRAMKLGSRSKDVDSFVDQLKSEGEKIISSNDVSNKAPTITSSVPQIDMEPIHVTLAEDINVRCGRDGGLQNMEIQGILKLRISDPEFGFIKVQVDNQETKPIQLQTHPNVDRDLWRSCAQIGMKFANKPFPPNTDVGVLKWRFQTTDESQIPLSINCWPQENGSGSCDVNIEYTLECKEMELDDVTIVIPLASGVPPPVINECEGEHELDKLHSTLIWRIPVIDKTCPTAAMDFTARGVPENFFPVKVNFVSKRPYCNLKL
ncbi:Coatomer subunit delta [Armadillidium vulgare]|nr:Coatomer subunit delta [Armadillidium vulgare]